MYIDFFGFRSVYGNFELISSSDFYLTHLNSDYRM